MFTGMVRMNTPSKGRWSTSVSLHRFFVGVHFFSFRFPCFFSLSLLFVFGLPGENVFGKWKPIWRKIRLKVLAWVICVASFLFQYAVPYFKVICSELSDLCISVKKQTIFHTISKSLIRRGCFEFSVRHANMRYTLWTWNTILLKPFLF